MNLLQIFQPGAPGEFRFAAPLFLFLLILLPPLLAVIRYRERTRVPTLRFANVRLLKRAGVRQSQFWRTALDVLRILAIALLIVAMARPQYGRVERQTYSEGIDIGLVLDVSLSMKTPDFYPNRLEAAKEVMKEFVDHRMGDRIGLTIFGTDAATLVPFTLDYGVVKAFIDRVRFNIVNGDTTAIGMGIATSLAKLRDSKAKSRIIILLTDGENNAGKIDPMSAAEAAKTTKVRIYTIGVGSDTGRQSMMGITSGGGIDETSLQKIASMTGGLYFRATDVQKLAQIYDQIDKLEKSEVESSQYDNFNDLSLYFILPAMLLLAVELLLRSTRFMRVP